VLSAHWRKAPYALVHYRSVLLSVFVAALLAALASSSSPFVTTAAASEALKNQLTELSSFATGLEIRTTGSQFGPASLRQLQQDAIQQVSAVDRLRINLGYTRRAVLTTEAGPVRVLGSKGESEVVLMSRTDSLAHVKVLAQVAGSGVWISDLTAKDAGVKPGETVRLEGLQSYLRPTSPRLRVKGIYRALAYSPESDYWGNLYQEIYPRPPDGGVPPPYVLMTNSALLHVLANRSGGASTVDLPADSSGLTLSGARALARKFDALRHTLRSSSLGQKLGCSSPGRSCTVISALSSAVVLADRNASAVTPAVTLLSDIGTALALAVAAAAGVFLVRRRRAEAALLYSRGEHVARFAARTAVEVLGPTLAGGAAGFAVAFALTDVFAPTGSLDPGTSRAGAAHAVVAVAIGLCLLVAAAGVSFLRLFDTGARRVSWLRWLPWEVPVLAAAVYLLVQITSGGGVTASGSSGAHNPTLAVFVFPLLLVAAVAGLAARGVRLMLRTRSGRVVRAQRTPVYLALRRLAASRGLLIVLAVVSAVSLGAFFYVETLANSLHHTTIEKAYMATGSDAQAVVQDSQTIPRSFPYPATKIQFGNQVATLGSSIGTAIDVMVVDPATLIRTLHWEADWGPNPTKALQTLAATPSQPLPVIVTSDLAKTRAIYIEDKRFPVRVLASVRAFPFMATGIPLLITSYSALDALEARTKFFDALGLVGTYVWVKGPPSEVGRALTSLAPTYPPQTIDTFLRNPDVVLATRTFRFMRLIAVGAGVLAILGLLLYLQARQRSQVIASALARRMGFGRLAEWVSLCLELGAILAFAGLVGGGVAVAAARPIVGHIDPLPNDPPSPIVAIPTGEILTAAGALVVLALAAGALTSWFANRADVGEALRVA
jgi:putative ABC transport system permease protein